MVPVQDHLNDDVVAYQRAAGDPRVAVRKRPHRVEDVRDRSDACVERPRGLPGGRIRVADGHDDAALLQDVDELERAVELRGERHLGDRSRAEEPAEKRRIGRPASRLGMNAEPLARDERPLEVGAEHTRADRFSRNLLQGGDELVLRGGDERRLEGRHAGLEQSLAGAPVAPAIGGREVDAAEAVDVQVDEAGNRDSATGPCEGHGGDMAVVDVDVTRDEDALDDRRFDAEPHGRSSAARTTPPAPASRARAASASVPDRSDTIATLGSPPAAARASSTRSTGSPVASSTTRRARSRSFALLGTTSTIRSPNVLPSLIMATVEMVLRIELLCRAGLHPRRTCDDFRPDDREDLVLHHRRELRAGRTDNADGQGAGVPRRARGRNHVRRPAARRERDHSVLRTDADACHVVDARGLVVLGRLLRHGERAGAARHYGDDGALAEAERRSALGGVDRREPPGGAGADVDEPSAAAETLCDRVDRGTERRCRRTNHTRHGRVLVIDELHELLRRAQVEVRPPSVPRLGDGVLRHRRRSVIPVVPKKQEWY